MVHCEGFGEAKLVWVVFFFFEGMTDFLVRQKLRWKGCGLVMHMEEIFGADETVGSGCVKVGAGV